MLGFEAWENELFDRYNGEGRMTEEDFWYEAYEDLREGNYEDREETE